MLDESGPTPFYSLETISQCLTNEESLGLLQNPLSLLDDSDERTWQLREFCTPMLIGVQHPSEHFQKLDAEFFKLLPRLWNDTRANLKHFPARRTRNRRQFPRLSNSLPGCHVCLSGISSYPLPTDSCRGRRRLYGRASRMEGGLRNTSYRNGNHDSSYLLRRIQALFSISFLTCRISLRTICS
jgi:hypothetical protein